MIKRTLESPEETEMTILAHIRKNMLDRIPTMPVSVWNADEDSFNSQNNGSTENGHEDH